MEEPSYKKRSQQSKEEKKVTSCSIGTRSSDADLLFQNVEFILTIVIRENHITFVDPKIIYSFLNKNEMRLNVFLTPGKSCPFSNFSAIRSKQPELLPVWIPTIKNVNRTTILICNSSSSCFLRQEIQDQLSKWPSNGSLAFTIFGEQRFY